VSANPFDALGLPARPDLTDEQVRAAWRAIAAATHPDRADGGDVRRYTAATAAYAVLRTPWGRSEAFADLDAAGDDTSPLPASPGFPVPGLSADERPFEAPARPGRLLAAACQLPARIRHGRPLRLLIRAAVAALLCLAVLALIPGQPAATALVAALITWFVVTGRSDLAPPRQR
jgi:curved DNA-binding protein CbpA